MISQNCDLPPPPHEVEGYSQKSLFQHCDLLIHYNSQDLEHPRQGGHPSHLPSLLGELGDDIQYHMDQVQRGSQGVGVNDGICNLSGLGIISVYPDDMCNIIQIKLASYVHGRWGPLPPSWESQGGFEKNNPI